MRTTVIATGGTIAWHERDGRMLSGAELLTAAGQTADEVVELGPVPSWDLSVTDMAEIAGRVRRAVQEGSGSVVVTHGTDTMEETAWLTELTLGAPLRQRASVLFTGAMRHADDASPDGPANLAWALQAGREPATAGRGVQVAWAGRLHPARWVRKVDAAAAEPFSTGGRRAAGEPPEPGPALNRNVAVLKVGPLARPPVPAGAAGVVLEGVGAANVPSLYHAVIGDLVEQGVPVVLASRCADVDRTRSAGADTTGSGGAPVLHAGDLTAEKAAIALMVGLGRHPRLADLRVWWSALLAAGAAGPGPERRPARDGPARPPRAR
jgi:L-asparaginase